MRIKKTYIIGILLIITIFCTVYITVARTDDVSDKIIDFGENYRVINLSKNHIPKYRYEINNSCGEIVKKEIVKRIAPIIRYVDESLLEIRIGVGTGLFRCQYFNSKDDVMSEIFYSPVLVKDEKIVYMDSNDNKLCLGRCKK